LARLTREASLAEALTGSPGPAVVAYVGTLLFVGVDMARRRELSLLEYVDVRPLHVAVVISGVCVLLETVLRIALG